MTGLCLPEAEVRNTAGSAARAAARRQQCGCGATITNPLGRQKCRECQLLAHNQGTP